MTRERWTLDEVCEKKSSNLMQKDLTLGTGEYPIYGASGLLGYVDFYQRDKEYIGIVKDGAGVGRAMLLPAKSSCIGTMQYLVPKDCISSHYLYYAVESMNLAKYNTGATIPHIYFRDYKKETLPKKGRDEQDYIASNLDKVVETIKKRRSQLQFFDDLVKSQFIEMFGNPQTNEKGYPLLTVDDVIEFQGGSQPDKSYFEYTKTDNNVRLIQIRDYKTDKFVTYIPKNMVKRYCYADDIMIGRYGPPIFQILQGIEGSYNVALMKAIPKKGNKEFIRQFLKQDCLLHYLEGLSKRTAGQDGIQMDKLKQYPFPYPPIELQEQFAHFAEQTDKSKIPFEAEVAAC